MNYGKAIAKKDIELSIWDGSGDTIQFHAGDVFVISYHEYDGSLGLTSPAGVEFCVDREERKAFDEYWKET
jgi:hypothetical protein